MNKKTNAKKDYIPELITAYVDKEVKCPVENDLAKTVITDDKEFKEEYTIQLVAKNIVSSKCKQKHVPDDIKQSIFHSTIDNKDASSKSDQKKKPE
jgi:hypothetical protein